MTPPRIDTEEAATMGLKAYQISMTDIFAGQDQEEAILAALEHYAYREKNTRADLVDEELLNELPPETKINFDCEDLVAMKTVGECLAEMTAPGMVATTDY